MDEFSEPVQTVNIVRQDYRATVPKRLNARQSENLAKSLIQTYWEYLMLYAKRF